MKKKIKWLILLILFIILILCGLIISVNMGYFSGNYQKKFHECSSKIVIENFERTFNLVLPKNMKNVKSAETIDFEYSTKAFLLKFTVTKDDEKDFLLSLKQGEGILLSDEYRQQLDRRHQAGFWSPPKWFTQPISKGFIEIYSTNGNENNFDAYIDMVSRDTYNIYINGFYKIK